MRTALLIATIATIATLFYLMTGLVYDEGSFDGALLIKPYPMYAMSFGGGEAGTWARHQPGEPPPWFMQADRTVLARFSWEQGEPAWVTAYAWGMLATLAAWIVLSILGAVRLAKVLARTREERTPDA
jgi:hypothetical protein